MSKGKVALITGAASGIGQALAVAYAQVGVKVVGSYVQHDPHDYKITEEKVKAAGGECILMPADVTVTEQVEALAEKAISGFGRLDYVVANAGLLRQASLPEMTDKQWNEMLEVDLTGVMRAFRAGVKRMSAGGALVAISSIAGGVYGWEQHAHYSAAKAGVLGLCRAVAMEFAEKGIRCNAVIPGLIETPQSLDPVNSLGQEGLKQAAKGIPLARVGKAAEVAQLVRYLTSDDASYITGQSIVIDGGLTVRWPG